MIVKMTLYNRKQSQRDIRQLTMKFRVKESVLLVDFTQHLAFQQRMTERFKVINQETIRKLENGKKTFLRWLNNNVSVHSLSMNTEMCSAQWCFRVELRK
jgi:Cu/Ag efflux protein CusF